MDSVQRIKVHAMYYGRVDMRTIRFPVAYEFDWTI